MKRRTFITTVLKAGISSQRYKVARLIPAVFAASSIEGFSMIAAIAVCCFAVNPFSGIEDPS